MRINARIRISQINVTLMHCNIRSRFLLRKWIKINDPDNNMSCLNQVEMFIKHSDHCLLMRTNYYNFLLLLLSLKRKKWITWMVMSRILFGRVVQRVAIYIRPSFLLINSTWRQMMPLVLISNNGHKHGCRIIKSGLIFNCRHLRRRTAVLPPFSVLLLHGLQFTVRRSLSFGTLRGVEGEFEVKIFMLVKAFGTQAEARNKLNKPGRRSFHAPGLHMNMQYRT